MRCFTAVVGNETGKLQTNVVQSRLIRLALLSALGLTLATANFGLAAENENGDKPKGSVSERPTGADRQNREKYDASSTDDTVRHHGALGVSLTKSADGVTVVGVIPGSPAERAGLRLGDEIRHVGDKRIYNTQELVEEVRESKPGTQIDLIIRRNGQRQVVSAKLGSQEATFGTSDRTRQYSTGYRNAPATRIAQPVSIGRAPNANPAKLNPSPNSQAQLNQQIRALQRQVYILNQQLMQLQSSQNDYSKEANEINDWWNRGQRGQNGDDPALFQ